MGKYDSNADVSIISSEKGFEGLESVVRGRQDRAYLFSLCKANTCVRSIAKKIADADLGYGCIVVLEKVVVTNKSRMLYFICLETVVFLVNIRFM